MRYWTKRKLNLTITHNIQNQNRKLYFPPSILFSFHYFPAKRCCIVIWKRTIGTGYIYNKIVIQIGSISPVFSLTSCLFTFFVFLTFCWFLSLGQKIKIGKNRGIIMNIHIMFKGFVTRIVVSIFSNLESTKALKISHKYVQFTRKTNFFID